MMIAFLMIHTMIMFIKTIILIYIDHIDDNTT